MIKSRLLMPPLCAIAMMLAACGSGTPSEGDGNAATRTAATTTRSTSSGTPTAAPAKRTYRARIMAWGRELAACVRSHGQTSFPDPVWPTDTVPADGDDSWGLGLFPTSGGKDELGAALSTCPDVVRRMPPNTDTRPPGAATLNHMKQFAACLRQHGLTDFPDPHADGRFPVLGGRYEGVMSAAGMTEQMRAAFAACGRYQVEWRMRATRG